MYEVLLEVGTRPLGFPQVKVLFHTFVACLLPLVILVEKAVHRLRVLFLAHVADRVDLVVIVLGPGNLRQLFLIREVTLRAVADCYPVEAVSP